MAIDRAAWRAEKLTERVVKALRDEPQRYPFMEQDALNATLKGNFMPLSPRFNFMGDFFLLDLERQLEPIVLHFVNAPKPWELDSGGARRGSLKTIAPGSPRRLGPSWRQPPAARRHGDGPGRRSRL